MHLALYELENAVHHNELVRQRRLCGWGEEDIPAWQDMIRSGERVFWWIFLESGDTDGSPIRLEDIEEKHNFVRADRSNLLLPPRDNTFLPIGHIALDHVLPDGEKATGKTSKITAPNVMHVLALSRKIATFFILLSQQSRGYGRLAMDRTEATAKETYGCQELLLDTIAKWTVYDKAWREANDLSDLRGKEDRSNAEWYERRGYQAYKEEPKYPWVKKDGTQIKLPAVFMRKKL